MIKKKRAAAARRSARRMVLFRGAETSGNSKKLILLGVVFLTLAGGLYAETAFPRGEFWALDAGFGMSRILVEGRSFHFILDPKIWLTPSFMVGSRLGANYSTDEILTFEGQIYLRWNFLRLGNPEKSFNFFAQGGAGLVASYRGNDNPFDDVTQTRGALLFDGAFGVTIPLTARLHLEPQVHGGYPHILGASLTAGYKFPLPE